MTAPTSTLAKIEVVIVLDDDGATYGITTHVGYKVDPELAERISEGIAAGLRGVGFDPTVTRISEVRS